MAFSQATDTGVIEDGHQDIAMRWDHARLQVSATGRKLFHRGYLWTWSNSGDIIGDEEKLEKYDPKQHSSIDDPVEKLPTAAELKDGGNSTILVQEVGVIKGNDLEVLTKPGGASRDKEYEDKRKKDPALARGNDVMRVFARVTDTIKKGPNFWVGCKPYEGRLYPKKIVGKYVFFHAEYWTGIEYTLPSKTRKNLILTAVAKAVARDKVEETRPRASITAGDFDKWTGSNPLAVTASEDLANTLKLRIATFDVTGDIAHLKTARQLIKNALPDLKDGPKASNAGLKEWYRYSYELDEEDATRIAQELKEAHSTMRTLSPTLIHKLHAVLTDGDLWKKLPRDLVPFFIELCHLKLAPTMDKRIIKERLPDLIEIVNLHGNHLPKWTKSKDSLNEGQMQQVLSATYVAIENVAEKLTGRAKAIVGQHGAMLPKDTVPELMKKVARAVDVTAQQLLHEQIALAHAGQMAGSFQEISTELEQIANLLRVALGETDRVMKDVEAEG